MSIVNYLRIIERTRLLYNSSTELGAAVGFSVESGNGLARKGGKSEFMKDAIFRELVYQTEQRTSLNYPRGLRPRIYACQFKSLGHRPDVSPVHPRPRWHLDGGRVFDRILAV